MRKPDTAPNLAAFIESATTGLAVCSWYPEDPKKSRWLYANAARCRMTGHTRDEILGGTPLEMAARETKSNLTPLLESLAKHRYFSFETMLLRKDDTALPARCHVTLVDIDGVDHLMIEYWDITETKQTREHLERMEENAREMLSYLEKEKQLLRVNMEQNLTRVVVPLIGQLMDSPPNGQMELINLIKDRISHIAGESGIINSITEAVELTRKQRLICEMIQEGMSTKAIAASMGCSPRTIDNHRSAIRKKLGIAGTGTSLDSHLSRPGI